ncbi:hypothetical protein AHF37_07113 [Paragonimus kellicotti]|nr:hypothetical protein AHF37_07113 [Paragonimus kellicotti]
MASITNLEKRLYSLTFTDELNVITSLVELQQQLSTATDAERRQMKERLLRSNVPRLLCATLKQDFSKVPGTWSHVTRLSNLLVIMVQVPYSSNPFLTDTSKELLSDITESMLILLRRLQKRLSSARSQSEKMEMSPNEFIVLIKKVLADLRGLVEWHVEAAYYIANSPWFLQLFIVDDPQLMEWFTTLLVECVKRKPSIVEHWSQNQKVNILDELNLPLCCDRFVGDCGSDVTVSQRGRYTPILKFFYITFVDRHQSMADFELCRLNAFPSRSCVN